MKLRPRYSILTLLVLTALIAGVTKFWFGPREIIEQRSADVEEQFTMTRDWHGTRTIHGPFIRRIFKPRTQDLHSVNVDFYRAGLKQEWSYAFFSELHELAPTSWPVKFDAKMKLTAEEQAYWQSAIEQELERLRSQGYRHQGMWMRSWLTDNLIKS